MGGEVLGNPAAGAAVQEGSHYDREQRLLAGGDLQGKALKMRLKTIATLFR